MEVLDKRDQIVEIIEKEFIGPDPIDWAGSLQENGEEVLSADPPLNRYISGILYPQQSQFSGEDTLEGDEDDNIVIAEEAFWEEENQKANNSVGLIAEEFNEYLEDAEELINLSNAYKPSAMSLTVAVDEEDEIKLLVNAALYKRNNIKGSQEDIGRQTFLRIPINRKIDYPLPIKKAKEKIERISIQGTDLRVSIIYRYKVGFVSVYTVVLENTKICSSGKGLKGKQRNPKAKECYFQVGLKLISKLGFLPIPESNFFNSDNDDIATNKLLYRKVRKYAVGHGCSADWENEDTVSWIKTSIFPRHEIKPIVPNSIKNIPLSMYDLSNLGDFEIGLEQLEGLIDNYEKWINGLEDELKTLESEYSEIALKHIDECRKCLRRMQNGLELLRKNNQVKNAFQFMNQAMLLQQLHSKLPYRQWVLKENSKLLLESYILTPDINDENTWYNKDSNVYGRWRPFQIGFILMNLESMSNLDSEERNIVDLIWFPTGGGKTEAYLGLSAFTIFLRRLINKNDYGTSIIMRYTLRLLTAQQYQRAASLICACEYLRNRNSHLFGDTRISIGLWVGGKTTPNRNEDAVKVFDELYNGKSDFNPFMMLQCPWCGAQMGLVKLGNNRTGVVGYRKIPHNKKARIIFQCANKDCEFSKEEYPLPLFIVDDDIYEFTPSLVLGTVDKFALLPYFPKAQSIFGFKKGEKISNPDLIIQDELHLISGPLGSMVGLYETMIFELCSLRDEGKTIYPKVVASTATISRAKEQCNALYGKSKEEVFQFPPPGLNYDNSFFAKVDNNQNGRQYIGIIAPGTTETTASIRLYAALLYAAKYMEVVEEKERDPYWTNIGYYNSIRELGQAATWVQADIKQHLHVIYNRNHFYKREDGTDYKKKRRYIYSSEELTSRIRSDKVTESLKKLETKYDSDFYDDRASKEKPIDICLATNMISVGLDVQRLGLMTVAGQPKTTSEYIQATSRIGRDSKNAPGLVFVLYKGGRPRDKSHYENFKSFHSKIYSYVEPTSVTPFVPPARERALHAILIGIIRVKNNIGNLDKPNLPSESILKHIKETILERVRLIDEGEVKHTAKQLEDIITKWGDWNPSKYHDFWGGEDLPLMYPSGTRPNKEWGENRGFKTPTSMRNVDGECKVRILDNSLAFGEARNGTL